MKIKYAVALLFATVFAASAIAQVPGGGGNNGAGGYTGAVATAPGTPGSSATPVQGVNNGVPLAVTWTGQTVTAQQPSNTTYAVSWTGQSVAATQSGAWSVSVSNFPTTQAVSGTVTANQGAPNSTANAWPTTDTNAAQTIAASGSSSSKAQAVQSPAGGALALAAGQPTNAALGSTTAGQTGSLALATTNGGSPSYTAGTTNALSMNTSGALRTAANAIYSGTQQNLAAGAPTAVQVDAAGQYKTSETGSADPLVGIVPNVVSGTTASTVKNSAGNLYGAYAILTAAASAQTYLVAINAAAAPASGAAITPVDIAVFPSNAVAAQATIDYKAGPPDAFSTGIVLLVTTSLTSYAPGSASFIVGRVR